MNRECVVTYGVPGNEGFAQCFFIVRKYSKVAAIESLEVEPFLP